MKKSTFILSVMLMLVLAAAVLAFRPFRYQSRYYEEADFESSDAPGSGKMMHPDTLRKLDKATDLYGQPFVITSAFRTETKNSSVGGVKNSSHLIGRAVDIDTVPSNHQEILNILLEAGFPRLVIYNGHIHADDNPDKPTGIFYA